jgi:hypothetical protein
VTNLNDIKKDNKELLLKIRAKKDEIDKLRILKNGMLNECKHVDPNTYRMFLQDDYSEDRNPQHSRASLARQSSGKLHIGHKEQVQEAKRGFQKIECELVSEIEFVSEQTQKMEFYIRDIKDKIRKHLAHYSCSPESFLDEVDLPDLP